MGQVWKNALYTFVTHFLQCISGVSLSEDIGSKRYKYKKKRPVLGTEGGNCLNAFVIRFNAKLHNYLKYFQELSLIALHNIFLYRPEMYHFC